MRFALAVFLLLPGCSRPDGGLMLHAVSSFAGRIEVTPDRSEQASSYELSFSRAKPYFSCKLTEQERVITLLGGPDGSLEVFENAQPRPASKAEIERFGLLSDLLDPRAIEAVEPGPSSYRIRRKGLWYSVRILPGGPGAHGHQAERK